MALFKKHGLSSKGIGWLHLSDLHCGISEQGWLWPTVEERFFEDLSRLHAKCGPWDLVFFTGDLTQRGAVDEFKRFDALLDKLWTHLRALGSNPLLLPVPGNHDLVRPNLEDAYAAALAEDWHNKPRVSSSFWSGNPPRYFQVVKTAFQNYTDWSARLPITKSDSYSPGIVPGDYSITFEKHELTLGIIGLNSAFLQLTGDNYERRLVVDPRQFQAACKGHGPDWVREHEICVLLTHHPLGWLTPADEEAFRAEISAPGRFAFHLFGHMHEFSPESHQVGGAESGHLIQGGSLFGLEHYEASGQKYQRTHGYSAGRMLPTVDGWAIRLWPRVLLRHRGKHWHVVSDPTITLLDDQGMRPEAITSHRLPKRSRGAAEQPEPPLADAAGAPNPDLVNLQVLWDRTSYRATHDNLRAVIRLNVSEEFAQADEHEESEERLNAQRIPVHHVLILDLSGSMDVPDKFPVLVTAVDQYLKVIDRSDFVTVIVFSTECHQFVDQELAGALRDRIHSIGDLIGQWPYKFQATQMSRALSLAISSIRRSEATGFQGVTRILCLTDGHLQDQIACKFTFNQLINSEVDLSILGFGTDFSHESARDLLATPTQAIIRYIRAGAEIVDYFSHLARTSQRIALTCAESVIRIEAGITCHNVFWCRPHEQHIGSFSDIVAPEIRIKINSMEYKKDYLLLLEMRVWEEQRQIGTVSFSGESAVGGVHETQVLNPTFGNSVSPEDGFIRDLANSVSSLLVDDRQTKILSLRSRIKLYESEGRPSAYIEALRRQLELFERGEGDEKLSHDDWNYVESMGQSETCGELPSWARRRPE